MFALYSLYWSLDVYLLWAKFDYLLLPQPASAPGISITQASWKGAPTTGGLPPGSFPMLFVQWLTGMILIVLGDFVSLWRAWAIFGKPRWLYIVLVSTAAIESAIFIMLFVSTSPAYLPTSSAFARVSAKARVPLTFLGYSVTGLAQISATSLIAYKAWAHWRDVREVAKSRNVAALVVVIETGIAYVLLLAFYGFVDFFEPKNSGWNVASVDRFYSVPLIAMYPTLVVVLVASRRTVLEEASTGSLGDMQFATGVVNRTESVSHIRDVGRTAHTTNRESYDSEYDIGRVTGGARDAVTSNGEELAPMEKGMVFPIGPSRFSVV
ncbi:unnamed protein product [Peniophora sp. CBMAI 1063]|nr:unnamed protein product [Peniophora sp. CBMAI 1063]